MKEDLKKDLKEYINLFLELNIKMKIILLFILLSSIAIPTLVFIENEINLLQLFSAYFTITFMMILAFIDSKLYIIPNFILAIWLICRTLLIGLESIYEFSFYPAITSLLGAFIIFMIFLAIHYITKRSLGGGDVKLSFVLGLSLTSSLIFTAIFYSLIISALFSIVALITKKLTRKDGIPLGPFMFLGTIAAYITLVI